MRSPAPGLRRGHPPRAPPALTPVTALRRPRLSRVPRGSSRGKSWPRPRRSGPAVTAPSAESCRFLAGRVALGGRQLRPSPRAASFLQEPRRRRGHRMRSTQSQSRGVRPSSMDELAPCPGAQRGHRPPAAAREGPLTVPGARGLGGQTLAGVRAFLIWVLCRHLSYFIHRNQIPSG